MVGQKQLVLSPEHACPVMIVRLHHSYSQPHEDLPDVEVSIGVGDRQCFSSQKLQF